MKDKQNESGALFFSIGWMSSAYFLSDNTNEKQTIAQLFEIIKQDYGIESNSLDLVIEDYHHGPDPI
jgi:uncharacterized tellurite resistance protein B-like protein